MNGEEVEKKRGKTKSMGEVVSVQYEKRESEQKQERMGGEYLSLHLDVCDGRQAAQDKDTADDVEPRKGLWEHDEAEVDCACLSHVSD
jgi:hypothetical protein